MTSSESKPVVSKLVQCCVFALVGVLTLGMETARWTDSESRDEALSGWLAGFNPDWLLYIPVLILFPMIAWGTGERKPRSGRLRSWLHQGVADRGWGHWLAGIFVFIAATGVSWWNMERFGDLPPAYHDEYSYLFQSETYLAGRLSFPSFEPAPELFNQMHVLNEGRFASRYFPGVGVWIAPFLALGHPYWGYCFAQGLIALFVYLAGRELSNNGVGLLAGLLCALSPGLILFSNLLLAHHPTLVGLSLFSWCFLSARRTHSRWMYLLAGFGLSYAMLCRPMTAAGFGLPFGIVFAWYWLVGRKESEHCFAQRTVEACCLGGPLVVGFLIAMGSNWAITGDALTAPYQLYTDIYTPRHVYGFNNVIRGEQHLGPKVIENYDTWAQNLTPELAWQNVQTRIVNSLRWTLGIVPIFASLLIILFSKGNRSWWLILAAILSLHVVHIPYWFEGIMGWHYVFETSVLWLLVVAEATRRLFSSWNQMQRPQFKWGWWAMLGIAVGLNLITVPPVWPGRLDRGVAEVTYPREKYQQFRDQIEQLRGGEPAIVFVIHDPADRSMDYVSNHPSMTGPVLVARVDSIAEAKEYAALFPNHMPILFTAANGQMQRINP